ncbi:YegP family protein [Asticcacaulis sp. SL142]|uniref:YegP family protein n=1 Tax=Asticcacaulis sp. SL142 TaxID=2995155 RepID=UPI00226C73DB|nr:YegP family protein [Asticcacaulis sp. SL142]WAC47363.1 YegP family protein [Asticcacaulis sp. SL142]
MTNANSLYQADKPVFEVFPTVNAQYYWRAKAANGRILCHSENYTTRQAAVDGVNSLIRNIKKYY